MKKNSITKAAFTLVETMVTVAILGILVSYATGSVRKSYSNGKVEQAASRLSFQLQQARSYALTNNQTVVVELNASTNALTTWIDEDGDAVRDAAEVKTVTLAESSVIGTTSSWSAALFNSYGQFLSSVNQNNITSENTVFASKIGDGTQTVSIRGSGSVIRQ